MEYKGTYIGKGLCFGIIVSRFNEAITSKLLAGAKKAFEFAGVSDENIDIVYVPGAFEIPLIADRMASLKKYDALVALGAVIKGETDHYNYICNEVAKGIARVGLIRQIPVIFGILTVKTLEQALERSGIKNNNGWHAALSAVEMANLLCSLCK